MRARTSPLDLPGLAYRFRGSPKMSFFPRGHGDGAQPLGDSEGSGRPSPHILSPVLAPSPHPARSQGLGTQPRPWLPKARHVQCAPVPRGRAPGAPGLRASPHLETASRTSPDTPLYPWLGLPSRLTAPLPTPQNPGPKHHPANPCTLTDSVLQTTDQNTEMNQTQHFVY